MFILEQDYKEDVDSRKKEKRKRRVSLLIDVDIDEERDVRWCYEHCVDWNQLHLLDFREL